MKIFAKLKEKRLLAWLVLNLAVSFMLCIFAPLEAYYTNKSEFWFTISQMLPVVFVAFTISMIIFGIVIAIFYRTQIALYVYTVLMGLLVYFYIQGNYIPRNYGVLNGNDIQWERHAEYGVASIICMLICVFACVMLLWKFKDKILKIGTVIGSFLLLIQVITIGTLFFQDFFSEAEVRTPARVTTEKALLDVSKDNNVIVFILDTFDGNDFNYLLENYYEKCADVFENFTYYKDTLGAYPTTKCALPQILTGKRYQNEEPYEEYIKKAYMDNDIYKTLKENNYTINAYTNTMYLSGESELYENIKQGTYIISDGVKFARKLYELVAFNYMPHQLKHFFPISTDEFANLRKSNTVDEVFSADVQMFAKKLEKEGLSVTKHGNLFKVYHLEGVHAPYTFGKNLTSEEKKSYTSYDEAQGNNTLMQMYFDELKKAGVYDNTTIVILADHGHVDYSQNPIFLIKNAMEKHEFAVSDAKMSYDYLDDIWISLANGEMVDEPYITRCAQENKERKYLYYTWDDAWDRTYMPGMTEMYFRGEAYNLENMYLSGKSYLADNADYSYKLGETLEFIEGRSGQNYCQYGIDAEGNVKNKAFLQFDLNEDYKNIQVDISLRDMFGAGYITAYVNDHMVAAYNCGEKKNISFIIPNEYIENGKIALLLEQAENGEEALNSVENTRIYIDEIKLTNTELPFDLERQREVAYYYKLGERLSFNAEKYNGCAYIKSGFSYPESKGTWTNGVKAILSFRIAEIVEDMVLEMEYQTFNGNQNVKVYVNDKLVKQYIASGYESKLIEIPASYLDGEYLNISLELPDACSPKTLGQGEDARKLALSMKSMKISKK